MLRQAALLACALVVTACTGARDLDAPPAPLGNFSLGHNVVVAPKVETTATVSREVSKEALTDALTMAIAERFERYEGEKEYHFGVSIEGYVLARAGVPVVLAPKSGMIIRLTVWDDKQGKKLNAEPAQLTVLEELNGASIVGTGWSQTKETQLKNLSRNAAQAIENYLVKKNEEEGWFNGGVAGTAASNADQPNPTSDAVAATTTE